MPAKLSRKKLKKLGNSTKQGKATHAPKSRKAREAVRSKENKIKKLIPSLLGGGPSDWDVDWLRIVFFCCGPSCNSHWILQSVFFFGRTFFRGRSKASSLLTVFILASLQMCLGGVKIQTLWGRRGLVWGQPAGGGGGGGLRQVG